MDEYKNLVRLRERLSETLMPIAVKVEERNAASARHFLAPDRYGSANLVVGREGLGPTEVTELLLEGS